MTIDEIKELMETGEEFELDGYTQLGHSHRFYEGTIQFIVKDNHGVGWIKSGISLNYILACPLIRKAWKPKYGDTFFYWSGERSVSNMVFNGHYVDIIFLSFGNCFRTKKECEKHTEIRDKLIEMRKEYVV